MANSYNSIHTGAWHDNQLSLDELFNRIYPVGSIYISMNETDPGTLFGGTWERISGRFLLGCGGTGPGANNSSGFGSLTTAQETWFSDLQPGSTGGEYQHTLSVAELPAHNHLRLYTESGPWVTSPLYGAFLYNTSPQTGNLLPNSTNWNATNANMQHRADLATGHTGSTQQHNNIPPYITVAMWQRIS